MFWGESLDRDDVNKISYIFRTAADLQAAREAFPDLEVLGVGAQDPLARIHAPNESIHLKELRDSIVAEAVFLLNLASG